MRLKYINKCYVLYVWASISCVYVSICRGGCIVYLLHFIQEWFRLTLVRFKGVRCVLVYS